MLHGPVGNARDQALFDLRQRALGDEQIGIGPTEQAVNNRVDNERADFQTKLSVQLLGPQEVKAGRVRQRVNELAVGELFDIRDGYFDNRAQVTRKRRAEIPAEPFVQRLEGPHLVFGNALGAFEIVDVNFELLVGGGGCAAPKHALRAVPRATPRATTAGTGCGDLPGIDRGEKGIDFGLIEYVSQARAASLPRRGCRLLHHGRCPYRYEALSDEPANYLQRRFCSPPECRVGYTLLILSPAAALAFGRAIGRSPLATAGFMLPKTLTCAACGRAVPVTSTMSGERLPCACGHWVQIPSEPASTSPVGSTTDARATGDSKPKPAAATVRVKSAYTVSSAVLMFVVGALFLAVGFGFYTSDDAMGLLGDSTRDTSRGAGVALVFAIVYRFFGKTGLVLLMASLAGIFIWGGFSTLRTARKNRGGSSN